MKTLPTDVWDSITQFIPALMLKDMINVNRYFFNLAMDYRYRQISFTYLNERMLWTLVRLKDPAVSYRVRTIYIYPDFLKQDLYAHINGIYPRDRSDILRYKLFLKTGKCCLPAGFLIEWMQDVLAGLPNVTNYHITWAGLPCLLQSPASLISTVFRTAPIERLTLTISLKNIQALDPRTFGWLRNLQELQILLQHDSESFLLPDNYALYGLAAAINNVRNTLRTLIIESWGPIHLCELLSLVDRLPHLEKLLMTLPANDLQLGNPSSLSAFLDLHRDSLRVLALRAEAAGLHTGRCEPFFLDHWLQEAIRGISLSKLQSLEINSSRILPETCLACIEAFSASLTSLSLTGQHQSIQFIDQMVSTLAGRDHQDFKGLESLRLGTVTLNMRLIDLLAEKLPGLRSLTLTIKDLKPASPPQSRRGWRHLSRCERREEQVEAFFSEMETRRYSHWRLRNVKLVLCMEDAEYWQTHVEAVLSECVPSIRSFG